MPTTQGIAKLWKPVVNVTDLDEGERFWSALTGLQPYARHGDETGDRFSVLSDPTDPVWMLLQRVRGRPDLLDRRDAPRPPGRRRGRCGAPHRGDRRDHRGTALLYPSDHHPYLEWAVMTKPFGNEFCFVRWPLTPGAPRQDPSSSSPYGLRR